MKQQAANRALNKKTEAKDTEMEEEKYFVLIMMMIVTLKLRKNNRQGNMGEKARPKVMLIFVLTT